MQPDSMPLPKISVVIPVYNSSSYIENCLKHIFNSEFRDYEVILVDDCSGDDTLQKISSYQCKVLKNTVNMGPAFSRNKAINEVRGSIVLFVDSDIFLPKDALGKIWDYFLKNENVSILQGSYDHHSHFKNLFSQYKNFVFSFRAFMDKKTYVNYTHTAYVAIRRYVFDSVQFDPQLRRREDVDFGLRCVEKGYLIYSDNELVGVHCKKYDLFSFSKYQFNTGKELVLQYLLAKNKNISKEFNSRGQSLYKKLWFLRPVISFLALLCVFWYIFKCTTASLFLLLLIFVLSFIVEYQFRMYLFCVAPIYISLSSFFIYFYDGLLVGLGVSCGVLEALRLKAFKESS